VGSRFLRRTGTALLHGLTWLLVADVVPVRAQLTDQPRFQSLHRVETESALERNRRDVGEDEEFDSVPSIKRVADLLTDAVSPSAVAPHAPAHPVDRAADVLHRGADDLHVDAGYGGSHALELDAATGAEIFADPAKARALQVCERWWGPGRGEVVEQKVLRSQ
jgi:hypothetical protein